VTFLDGVVTLGEEVFKKGLIPDCLTEAQRTKDRDFLQAKFFTGCDLAADPSKGANAAGFSVRFLDAAEKSRLEGVDRDQKSVAK